MHHVSSHILLLVEIAGYLRANSPASHNAIRESGDPCPAGLVLVFWDMASLLKYAYVVPFHVVHAGSLRIFTPDGEVAAG